MILYHILFNKALTLKVLAIHNYVELRDWYLQGSNSSIELPLRINTTNSIVELETVINIKNIDENVKPYLYIQGDIDAILLINNDYYYGIDRWTKLIPLPSINDRLRLKLRIFNKRVFGERFKDIILENVYLFYIDEIVNNYADKALWLLELIRCIDDEELKSELLNALKNSMDLVEPPIPSPKQLLYAEKLKYPTYFSMLYDELLRYARDRPDLLVNAGYGYLDYNKLHEEIRHAEAELSRGLSLLRKKYPKRGILHVLAHSHIDTAWLWSFRDTIHKVGRTLSKIIKQLEHYPEPVYVFSSALYLEWLKKKYPMLYERVIKYVNENRIIMVGGMWVESDTIITPSESLVRQFIYGQRSFIKHVGYKSWIGWLPDSFGYSANLPQILREAGIKLFIMHKTEWNKYNKIPYHTFRWKGIDGSEVLTHVLIGTYSQECNASSLLNVWKKYHEKHIIPRLLYTYGYGDGGGGPTDEMYKRLSFYGYETPLTPSIIHGGLDEFYEELVKHYNELPVWYNELYVELHRGTYTTNTCIKKLVWYTDYMLRLLEQTEVWASLRKGKFDRERWEKINDMWKDYLISCFHDILPGTAVREVYDEICEMLADIITKARRMINENLESLTGDIKGIIVYNPIQYPRREVVEVDINGEKKLFKIEIPGFSYKVIPLYKLQRQSSDHVISVIEKQDTIIIENKYFIIKINKSDGSIKSIYDKEEKREVLEKPSNILTVHEDIPHAWDAWDIDEYTIKRYKVLNAESVEIIEHNPLRVVVRNTYQLRRSKIIVDIIVYNDSRRIDFHVKTRFRERRKLLKTWFYPQLNSYEAYFDTPYGVVKRSAHKNTSWEQAKFEVPMLSWMSIEEEGYGFAVLSPVKHGVSIEFNSIGLSLLRTPIYPDPLSDSDEIEFMYSIMPYRGTWISAGVYIEAKRIQNPLYIYVKEKGKELGDEKTEKLLDVKPDNVIIEVVKKGFDDNTIVIRGYETANKRGILTITLNTEITDAWRVNILEEKINDVDVQGKDIRYRYKPYEVFTIKIFPV